MITKDQALQYALMLKSGMPSVDCMGYFYPDQDVAGLIALVKEWHKSELVQKAILATQGKPWQDMSLDEQIRFAIDKNYSEMAYYLYSHNYSTLDGTAKQKADTCRTALEQKVAGTAGQMNPLTTFWNEIRTGKVKLGPKSGLEAVQ